MSKLAYFHTGRGGRFYNAGHRTFVKIVSDISEIIPGTASFIPANKIEGLEDFLFDSWVNEDWEDEGLKELQNSLRMTDMEFRERKLDNMGGKSIDLEMNEDGTGYINWDNDYDFDVVCNLSDCDEDDLILILKSNPWDLYQVLEEIKKIAQENNYYDVLEMIEA